MVDDLYVWQNPSQGGGVCGSGIVINIIYEGAFINALTPYSNILTAVQVPRLLVLPYDFEIMLIARITDTYIKLFE